MASEKRLYRSRDALIGGVCSGIAEYFDIDPIVTRILAVVLTLASAGALAIAYIALWIILPLAPDPAVPLEVQPESVHSDTHGPIDFDAAKPKPHTGSEDRTAAHPTAQAAPYSPYANAGASYAGTGHVPPEPPKPYADVASPHVARASRVSQAAYTVPIPPTAQAAYAPPVGAPVQPAEPVSGKSVRAALWLGFLCLFIGCAAILSQFIDGVAWWRFWPLLLVIVGIGNVVIPAPRGRRMGQFVNGLMSIAAGVVLLAMSLEIIDWSSIVPMLEELWPLLVMMVGFFILASALHNPLCELLAGLCFVGFCVVGLVWFAEPGSTDFITLALPFKEALTIDVNPWH